MRLRKYIIPEGHSKNLPGMCEIMPRPPRLIVVRTDASHTTAGPLADMTSATLAYDHNAFILRPGSQAVLVVDKAIDDSTLESSH